MYWWNREVQLLRMLLAVITMVMTGCSAGQTASPSVTIESITLTPYSSPTPSATPEELELDLVTPTLSPSATPTPMLYTIVEGDTMLGIALRLGISLEELQTANPEVNPRLLVVGTSLVIPLGDILPENPATATPLPIQVDRTNCYLAPDGIWCFVLIKNQRARALENLSAQVVLYDLTGEILTQGTAFGPLNFVAAGQEIPLAVFFPGRFPPDFTATAKILTGHLVPKNDDRYLNAWLEIDEVRIDGGGNQAELAGSIGLPAKSQPGSVTWILVVAYDPAGNVVGIRKVEQLGQFEPGSSRTFETSVFSLGSAISDVKSLVEVRP